MDNYKDKWQSMLNYSLSFLNNEEKKWIIDYEEAGESELTFELIVGFILDKKIPLTEELYKWVIWYGSETEKLGNELDSDWKKVQFPDDK